jgi:two-component system NtrC family sensor kinase
MSVIRTLPADAEGPQLRAEIERLNRVVRALMNGAERAMNAEGSNFSLFQTTLILEDEVRRRTRELESALHENERINSDLVDEREEQKQLIRKLEDAHGQLLQSEKLASIGQLAAGVAHEVNNPIGFVHSNLNTLSNYIKQLLQVIECYQEVCTESLHDEAALARIEQVRREMDLEFLRQDVVELIAESIEGTGRVRRIVQDLRDFSRTGDVEWKWSDIHAGIDSALNVASNEIKYKADVVKEYGDLPLVECIQSQLNQVFLNLLVNSAQAIQGRGTITIRTCREGDQACLIFSDSGRGIPPDVLPRIFDPFFTTKAVGSGTGLGLSLAYGIVQKHKGSIEVVSEVDKGTTFTIRLPIQHTADALE